jgi:hypothetical protein
MTLIVGANLGSVVLLAADSIQKFYRNDVLLETRDDVQKIARTANGLFAAAGIIEIYTPIYKQLAARSHRPEEVTDLMSSSLEDWAEQTKHVTDERTKDLLVHHTSFFATGLGPGRPSLTLFHPADNYAPEVFSPGQAQSLLPYDVPPGTTRPQQTALLQGLRQAQQASNLDILFARALEAIKAYFAFMHAKSADVGSRFQVGVHTAGEEVEILELMPVAED